MSGVVAMRGWLLAKRPFGDTSLIVDVLTLERGRIDLMAKGGRKNALLEPFRPLWISAAGRGNLPWLQKVEPSGTAMTCQGDSLWCAFYVNELLTRLLPQGMPSVVLFALYGETLQQLADNQQVQRALRRFEQALLIECGYAPDLTMDQVGNPIHPAGLYQLWDNQLVASNTGFSGATLLAWQQGEWNQAVAQTARRLLREVLDHCLGGKPLKSRDMFYSLKRMAASGSSKESSNE